MRKFEVCLRVTSSILFLLLFGSSARADSTSFSEPDALVLNLIQSDFSRILTRIFQKEIEEGFKREKNNPKRGWYGLEYTVHVQPPKVSIEPGGKIVIEVDIKDAKAHAKRFTKRLKGIFKGIYVDCNDISAETDPNSPMKVIVPARFTIDNDLVAIPEQPTIVNRTKGVILHKPEHCDKSGFLVSVGWPLLESKLQKESAKVELSLLRSIKRALARLSKGGFVRRKIEVNTLGAEKESFPLWVYPQTLDTDHESFYLSLGAGTEEKPPSKFAPSTLLPDSERSYFALSVGLINQVSQRFFENLRAYVLPLKGDVARAVAYNLFEEAKDLTGKDVVSIQVDARSAPRLSLDTASGKARIRLKLRNIEISLQAGEGEQAHRVGKRVIEEINALVTPYIGPLGLAWQIDETTVSVKKNHPGDQGANQVRAVLQEIVVAKLWSASVHGVGVGFLENESGQRGYFNAVGDRLIIDLNRTGVFTNQRPPVKLQAKR